MLDTSRCCETNGNFVQHPLSSSNGVDWDFAAASAAKSGSFSTWRSRPPFGLPVDAHYEEGVFVFEQTVCLIRGNYR